MRPVRAPNHTVRIALHQRPRKRHDIIIRRACNSQTLRTRDLAPNIGVLVEKLHALKGNALVVGHGNTIPDLLKTLGIATAASIPDDDYTEIFVVLVGDTPQLFRLHYPF